MKIIFYANTEWYLYNFRLGLARYLRAQGHEVVMVSPPGKYGARLEAEGFRWIALDMRRRSLNPLREASMVHGLAAIYRAEAPDIVHHFTLKCIIYGGIAARMAGVPATVNAIVGLGYVFASRRLSTRLVLRPVVRRLLRWVCSQPGAAVIVQNTDDLGFMRKLHLPASTYIALIRGSGVDTSRFARLPAEPDDAPDRPLVILFVGRLLYDKGIVDFVEMAVRCRQEARRALHFVVAGEPDPGNPASIPEAQLQQWKDAGHVEFLGHVEDMPPLLGRADIVVLPSRTEGAPRSLIEAAACSIPVVTNDVPGCREVVVDGRTGFLVPLRDVGQLATAVLRLAHDDELRREMGEAGRRLILDNFDDQIVFSRTAAVYAELQPDRRAGTPGAERPERMPDSRGRMSAGAGDTGPNAGSRAPLPCVDSGAADRG